MAAVETVQPKQCLPGALGVKCLEKLGFLPALPRKKGEKPCMCWEPGGFEEPNVDT